MSASLGGGLLADGAAAAGIGAEVETVGWDAAGSGAGGVDTTGWDTAGGTTGTWETAG